MSPIEHLNEKDLAESLTRSQQRHVDHCPSCARRRSTVLAVREAVRALPRTAEPPASVLLMLDTPTFAARPSESRRWWIAGAAVSAAVILLGGFLWQRDRALGRPLADDLAQEIALDHLHYEHNRGAAEVTGDTEHIESYFAQKLQRRPNLAELEGTELIGGKSCRIGGEWSALVWIERAGHWLSLFSLPQDAVASRGCTRASGVAVCGIPDPHGGSRLLAGNLPDAELLRLLDESTE